MIWALKVCFLVFGVLEVSECLKFKIHPDRGLSIVQVISKYGYPVEIHNVKTEDDYFITLYRIPHSRNSTKVHKYPVILFPGTCGCSENFITTGPENAIGYYLSDRGFDVWLANSRGNRHARRHATLDPDRDEEYWEFGWHEVAVYDTPTIVEHVLKVAKAEQVFYIGHSQGTTSFFAFAAQLPEYNKKIRLSIHMAPSAFLEEMYSGARFLVKHNKLVDTLFRNFKFFMIPPKPLDTIINNLGRTLCTEMTFFVDICYLLAYFFNYLPQNTIDPTILQVALETSPAGCSLKELIHYFQIAETGAFRQYDYGSKKNLKIYGSTTPPSYNLSQITSPVGLFFAERDNLAPADGVRKLAKILPKTEILYGVPYKNFQHIDFLFSKLSNELVYKPIHELFLKYLKDD